MPNDTHLLFRLMCLVSGRPLGSVNQCIVIGVCTSWRGNTLARYGIRDDLTSSNPESL